MRAWFRKIWGREPPLMHDAVDLEPVRRAVADASRGSEEVNRRLRFYQDAENPLFALMSRAINNQAMGDDEPNS